MVILFEGDNSETQYDFNWEYLLFVIPLPNLSKITERYLEDIEGIEAKRQERYAAFREAKLQEESIVTGKQIGRAHV